MSTKRIALLGLLTAFSHVGRLMFAPIANVQPVSAILILLTLHLGVVDALIVATLSMLISNITLGMGVWTIGQIGSYAVVILLTALVKQVQDYLPEIILALYAGFTGYVYGFLISVFSAWVYQLPSFWVYYIQGIPFDTMHAVGNFFFYLILSPILSQLIQKMLRKYS